MLKVHGNRPTTLLGATLFLLAVSATDGQSLQIAIIDFYGLQQASQTQARSALTVKEGDTIVIAGEAPPAFVTESKHRLSSLPGVLCRGPMRREVERDKSVTALSPDLVIL